MKRYVRASYDSSMPDWLKTEAGRIALKNLTQKYAISDAKFSKTPTEGSIPIYLLDEVYKDEKKWGEIYKVSAGQYVYVPEFSWYDSRYLDTGKSFRSIAKASKARLEEHIIDTVYMTATLRSDIQKDRGYMDPRYERSFHDGEIEYAGQTAEYDSHYNPETKNWEKDKDPYYSVPTGRDKSGYQIPNPEDLYIRLYERFPDRLKGRLNEAKAILDEYYDKLDKAKTDLFSKYDIRKGKAPSYYGDHYKSPSYKLQDAIEQYGWMYQDFDACINNDGSVNPTKLAEFMKSSGYGSLSSRTKNIDKDLKDFYERLG